MQGIGNDAALGYSSVKLIYTNRRLSTCNIDLTSVMSCFMLSITHRFLSMSSVNSIVILNSRIPGKFYKCKYTTVGFLSSVLLILLSALYGRNDTNDLGGGG